MPVAADRPVVDPIDTIIGQLYEAAAGLLPWPTALSSLTQAFGAMVVQYVSIDKETGRMLVCEQTEGMVVDAVLDYVREYHRVDPHVQQMKDLPLGTVYDTEDVFPARRMASHPFYRDFWAPYGVRGTLAGKVDEGERHYSGIGIVRHKDSPRYTAADLALAARVVHHLSIAFKVARQVRKLQTTSRVGLHLMNHADRPMMLLDGERRVLFANAAGHERLEQGELLTEHDGTLRARSAAGHLALLSTLASLGTQTALDPASESKAPPRSRAALRLADAAGSVTLCTLWKLDQDHAAPAFSDDGVVLLSMAHPLLGQAPDVHFIAAMLDLTPAEARVASQLAVGHSLAAIASTHGVSITTVKTQLRSIFSKTGTQRQTELMQMIGRACAP